jgi:hypothetical protein
MDHLDGITFVDRLPLISRLKLKPALLRLRSKWKKLDESKLKPLPSGGEPERRI